MAENEKIGQIPDFDFPELDLELEDPTNPSIKDDNKDDIIDNETDTNVNSDPIESDPVAVAFFEQIKNRGYVDNDVEFKGSWEELDEYFDTLPQQVLNAVVESYPDVSKDVMRFIATAGDNITKEEMKSFFETYFEDISNKELTIETSDDARSFLQEHYKGLGLKEKAINNTLDALEEDDELISEAKKLSEEKTKVSAAQKLIEQKSGENAEIARKNQERASKIQEELKSTGWNQNVVTEVATVLSGKNFNQKFNEILQNPKGVVQLGNLMRLFNNKTGEFDLSGFVKQKESTVVDTLKKRLEDASFNSTSVSSGGNKDASKKDVFEGLEPVL